jgi:hypothetical protein
MLYSAPEAEVGNSTIPTAALVPSFCSIGTILPLSNRRHECKRFFLSCLFTWALSFVRPRRRLSSAPTVDF